MPQALASVAVSNTPTKALRLVNLGDLEPPPTFVQMIAAIHRTNGYAPVQCPRNIMDRLVQLDRECFAAGYALSSAGTSATVHNCFPPSATRTSTQFLHVRVHPPRNHPEIGYI